LIRIIRTWAGQQPAPQPWARDKTAMTEIGHLSVIAVVCG
jgi:hypothetical protein